MSGHCLDCGNVMCVCSYTKNNMNEEKEKAYSRQVFEMQGLHVDEMDFNAGFDAGVLAERERIQKKFTIEFPNIMPTWMHETLFPQAGEVE